MEGGDILLVSVIIPTYNRATMVIEAIESVLAQTYRNIEVIVVDDGSVDDTEILVARITDERLRYLKIPHAGRSVARNHGIRHARGEYIAFLDSDDLFLPDKISKQVEVLRGQSIVGLVCSSAYFVTVTEEVSQAVVPWHKGLDEMLRGFKVDYIYHETKSGDIYRDVMIYDPSFTLILPTVMVKKSVFDLAGYFDESMSRIEDIDMWRRISKHVYCQSLIEPLTIVRRHEGNTVETTTELLGSIDYYVGKLFSEDSNKVGKNFIRKKAAKMYLTYYLFLNEQASSCRSFLARAVKYYALAILADVWRIAIMPFRRLGRRAL
ncbi:MAG TPA: glycosyltransferase family 2 protein [bacterium]|nr:glycosyltransferase family 2 protein [bacterium]